MLLLDRYLGFHFFTTDGQGNAMMYVNLFWVWGHPEVYILVLPAFGIFSEVVSTFSGKPLFGYRSMVAATMSICVLSFIVWLHHFFTMGAGANVNGFFGVMTMIIAVPTGVKVFNWLFTMYGGRVRFEVPILWSIGFMVTFVIGGMTGVLMAVPPADFQLHNSLFLIAHFHNVIIGGTVFGLMAGYNYWFPKAFGFKLDERWGRASFWCWLIGFYVAFMPLYALGLMGMTRRMQHYDVASWQPWLVVAAIGAVIILVGIVCQVIQLVVSIRDREQLKVTADPWNGRTLEWATASPPPPWNFAALPQVTDIDALWKAKQREHAHPQPARERKFASIEVPKNSATGFITAFFAVVTGFALIWHIWWMAAVGVIGAFLTMLAFAFRSEDELEIPAEQIARFEQVNHAEIAV
jgi:cytochrome o ubiquinol oxidase subunit I